MTDHHYSKKKRALPLVGVLIAAQSTAVGAYTSPFNTLTETLMRPSPSPSLTRSLHLHAHTSNRKSFRRSIRMSAMDEVETGPVFEDVDGIGELTIGTTQHGTVTVTVNDNDPATVSNISVVQLSNDGIDEVLLNIAEYKQILDPLLEGQDVPVPAVANFDTAAAAAMEEILGAALSDPEVHGSVPAKNFKQEAEAHDEKLLEIEEEEEVIEAPRLSKIIKFAIPAIGVWLCSPLLSLIDTSAVGLLSGTAQQAALNPAVAVTDYSALLVAFMYTATTNLVAGAKESEKNSVDKPKTSKTLIQSLQLSSYVGISLGSVLCLIAPLMLKGIIGNDSIDPEVFSAALRYVRIRSLGFPAAVVIGSAQSACLGMQDIKSPMYVLAAAAIVNFFGDMIFVPSSNLWFGGAAGAAWATVFSQYAALALFIKWLRSKPKPATINLTKAILELTGKSNEGESRRKQFRKALRTASQDMQDVIEVKTRPFSNLFKRGPAKKVAVPQDSFTTRGFLAGQLRKRDLLKFPPLKDAKEFWPYVIPVTTTSVGRVSAYVAMCNVVSSSLGPLSMAANQVILSVFYCLTPVADSLNLTAQSFVPGIFQKKWGPARADALRKTTQNFMKAGLIFGCAMVSIVAAIPLFSKYFTSDPLVIAQVNSVVPLLAGIFAVHGFIQAGEGLLLGQRDLGFIGKTFGSYFFAVPWFMLRLKKVVETGVKTVDLTSLWQVFLGYQIVRLAVWGVRIPLLDRRARRPAPVKKA